jgi:putative acetyltransferase
VVDTDKEGRHGTPLAIAEAGVGVDAIYRRATNQDQAVVVRIVDSALREYGLGVLLDSSDVDLTDLARHYDARGGRLELIEDVDGAALGVVGWRDAGGGVIELKKLYLAPAARGRGLGRRAVARVVDAARAAGAQAVVLETAVVLAEANRLYQRCGFRPVRGAEAASFDVLSQQCDLAYRLDLAVAIASEA